MSKKKPKIRVIALGLIRDGDRLFLSEGYDKDKDQTFYRALGGGVDFGETSREALKREFQEELNAELTEIEYLGCIESIFTHQSKPGHEIIQLYRAQFVDPTFYQQNRFTFHENKRSKTALWVNIEACKSGEVRVVPAEFLAYL
ncbi:NUDIX hydrolase [Roseofilum capinflatum]|uniref:NUDIX domain-containing protein n=1 Tax=Roseofilum capinflatum BLCC-M114 TaxID=3022440 RepID=A0ABT7B3A7_9CYAN|nr:NUDIX domain-containing protein [Roseofilum capinflatum]MDJ1173635.1 NUDIX domain-containing protein [Roseofilum capinflatum BLCC-M114]